MMKQALRNFLNRLPYLRSLAQMVNILEMNSNVLPGHFYSPIFNVEELHTREQEIWKSESVAEIPGIDLNIEAQFELIKTWKSFESDFNFPENAESSPHHRYFLNNRYFKYTDGFVLYCMIRQFKPGKIIEAGSGFTSALMLDTVDAFQLNTAFTFIDPFPERLLQLLKSDDSKRCSIHTSNVQQLPVTLFDTLEANDLLFIDSSHVSKMGSDVNYLLFEILPRLKPGVIIHIHDIFHPFLYPKKWVYGGINWNEAFVVRALLSNSSRYEILLFTDYLQRFYPKAFDPYPVTKKSQGQSLYIRVK